MFFSEVLSSNGGVVGDGKDGVLTACPLLIIINSPQRLLIMGCYRLSIPALYT